MAAKEATKTIPVVFSSGAALEIGLVISLNHPGGNLTGVSNLSPQLGTRRLQILHELVPRLRTVGVVLQRGEQSAQAVLQEVIGASKSLSIEIVVAEVEATVDYETLFKSLAGQGVQALMVIGLNGFAPRAEAIANAALRNGLPTMFNNRPFPVAGGLASYGQNDSNTPPLHARIVDLIIKGAKPGDIPVVQPAEFELVINNRTAKALGLTLTPAIHAQLTELIE